MKKVKLISISFTVFIHFSVFLHTYTLLCSFFTSSIVLAKRRLLHIISFFHFFCFSHIFGEADALCFFVEADAHLRISSDKKAKELKKQEAEALENSRGASASTKNQKKPSCGSEELR
uniref:Uncharacterized protein n=1 Tax=Pediastrum duplex TaxID=3105 RepID=A0A2U8GIV0_PEDDU|nr:hypothetical protein [Pediastrum duplex]